jgi:ribokinase
VSGRVLVVGSANVDQVYSVERIPEPGETVLATGSAIARGGKGQNQAVAAARAGAPTAFIAAVGDDGFGRLTRDGLAEDGIDLSRVRVVSEPTGTALIAVDRGGENTIIVEAGANRTLGWEDADRPLVAAADVLVMQLEIPLSTVRDAAAAARAAGTLVVVNAAPAAELPRELLDLIDVLVVNEHEEALIRTSAGVERLTELVPLVVVTLGAAGARVLRASGEDRHVPAPRVDAVDATGAGDTFCGAFAAALAEGADPEQALAFAVAAASLSVQRHGAVPSIPRRAEIDAAVASAGPR